MDLKLNPFEDDKIKNKTINLMEQTMMERTMTITTSLERDGLSSIEEEIWEMETTRNGPSTSRVTKCTKITSTSDDLDDALMIEDGAAVDCHRTLSRMMNKMTMTDPIKVDEMENLQFTTDSGFTTLSTADDIRKIGPITRSMRKRSSTAIAKYDDAKPKKTKNRIVNFTSKAFGTDTGSSIPRKGRDPSASKNNSTGPKCTNRSTGRFPSAAPSTSSTQTIYTFSSTPSMSEIQSRAFEIDLGNRCTEHEQNRNTTVTAACEIAAHEQDPNISIDPSHEKNQNISIMKNTTITASHEKNLNGSIDASHEKNPNVSITAVHVKNPNPDTNNPDTNYKIDEEDHLKNLFDSKLSKVLHKLKYRTKVIENGIYSVFIHVTLLRCRDSRVIFLYDKHEQILSIVLRRLAPEFLLSRQSVTLETGSPSTLKMELIFKRNPMFEWLNLCESKKVPRKKKESQPVLWSLKTRACCYFVFLEST